MFTDVPSVKVNSSVLRRSEQEDVSSITVAEAKPQETSKTDAAAEQNRNSQTQLEQIRKELDALKQQIDKLMQLQPQIDAWTQLEQIRKDYDALKQQIDKLQSQSDCSAEQITDLTQSTNILFENYKRAENDNFSIRQQIIEIIEPVQQLIQRQQQSDVTQQESEVTNQKLEVRQQERMLRQQEPVRQQELDKTTSTTDLTDSSTEDQNDDESCCSGCVSS